MSNQGYYRASQDDLAALSKKLREESPWKEIDILPYESAANQLQTPILPLLKRRLLQRNEALLAALGSASDALTKLDAAWDVAQRRFVRRIEDAEEGDEQERAAAARLRNALLLGGGLAQTRLPFREEVTFGEKQVALARREPLHTDIKTLELSPLVDEIRARTAALAEGLRAVPFQSEKTTRTAQIRIATSRLAEQLERTDDELSMQEEEASDAKTKTQLQSLIGALRKIIPAPELTDKTAARPAPATEPQPK